MQRHEIPTHLEVEDKIFGSLTVRQLLVLAVGLSLSYGLWSLLRHVTTGRVPIAVEILLAAIPALCTLALALVQPGGRPFEEWLLTLLRFATLPRVCIWRSLSVERPSPPLQGGVR